MAGALLHLRTAPQGLLLPVPLPSKTTLKAVNPAALIAFFVGILMTWMCMYGSIPVLQGPIATAVGGIDFSWLAGTVTAAGVYFALGYRRFRTRIDAGVPLGLKAGICDEDALRQQQESEREQEAVDLGSDPTSGAAPEAQPESAPAPLG